MSLWIVFVVILTLGVLIQLASKFADFYSDARYFQAPIKDDNGIEWAVKQSYDDQFLMLRKNEQGNYEHTYMPREDVARLYKKQNSTQLYRYLKHL